MKEWINTTKTTELKCKQYGLTGIKCYLSELHSGFVVWFGFSNTWS